MKSMHTIRDIAHDEATERLFDLKNEDEGAFIKSIEKRDDDKIIVTNKLDDVTTITFTDENATMETSGGTTQILDTKKLGGTNVLLASIIIQLQIIYLQHKMLNDIKDAKTNGK